MSSVPPPSLHTHPEVPDGVVPAPRPELSPEDSLAPVPWWAPLAAMLVAFIVATIAYLVLAAAVEGAGGNVTAAGPPGLVISATLIQDAALIAAAWMFAGIWSRGLTPAAFGLRPTALRSAVGWTILTFIAFWVLTAIYVQIVGQPDQQELTRDLHDEQSLAALIGYAVLLAFVAPLCEEFFFRGFTYGVLREKFGVAGGTILTGIVFGLVHVAGSPLETVGVLVILGMLLCVLYQRTGSLLPCIALHAINNGISFCATKDLSVPGAIAIVLATSGAAVAVAAAVIQRSPALPGAPRTPR
jgi:membrane protease YdiL (CAAX protease family)